MAAAGAGLGVSATDWLRWGALTASLSETSFAAIVHQGGEKVSPPMEVFWDGIVDPKQKAPASACVVATRPKPDQADWGRRAVPLPRQPLPSRRQRALGQDF